ncbi:class F sortase, partial [Yinghuangia soli]
ASAVPPPSAAPEPPRDAVPGPAQSDGPQTPPTAVRVPALGLSAPVVAVGVAPDGQTEVPPDGRTVGWYRFGPQPGAPAGSAVLVGHVDTADGRLGEFAKLDGIKTGDRVLVQRAGDAAPLAYRVTRAETTAKSGFPAADIFRRAGPPQLVLVTCGGSYDRQAGGYQANFVVTAVPEAP